MRSGSRVYRLLTPGGVVESARPGTLGGNRAAKIYGRLDCPSAKRALARGGYATSRVFFADEATAIACGYRPCVRCLPQQYASWKAERRDRARS